MLEMIRKGASTWTARILLALLALSFVYWGADVRSTNTAANVLATVGDRVITQGELERSLDLELEQLAQRAGRRITVTEARAFGLDRRVLQRLIATAALDHKAADLGLALSETAVAQSIARDPAFHGLDGRFDRQGFDQILRSIGMRERDFLDLRRREEVREQLTQALVAAIVTPQPLVAATQVWQGETRIVEHLTIDGETAVTVPKPDEAKLKEVYEANKLRFTAPEYRSLEVLMMSVERMKTAMAVTDAEIAARYEETKESFATPERRRVQQIAFKDKAAAQSAKAAIAAGKNFMVVAQEMGLKDSDVDLGLVTRKSLVDPKIAEAAFGLPKDTVSDVVEGRLTTVLLRVPEIAAGTQPTLQDVRPRLLEALQREKASAKVREMRDEVEDLRTAGKTNAEIVAAKPGLVIVPVPETDTSNKTKDGKPALDDPDAAKITLAGFDARSAAEREAVDLADGGAAWVSTLATTPTRQKPFEEVVAEVETLHVGNERARLLRDLAQTLADRLAAGEAIEAVAGAHKATVSRTEAITRTTTPQGLTQAAVAQAFTLPRGKAGHAETADRKGRAVFRVAEITPAPAPTKDQTDAVAREIGQQMQSDTLDAFIVALQDSIGVKIDEARIRQAQGAPTTP